MKNLRKESRYDSIIIWGHGLSYLEEILMMLRKIETFDIVRIVKYKPSNMKKFIRKVYSYDYAPLAHLKSKIKYLEKVILFTDEVIKFIVCLYHKVTNVLIFNEWTFPEV
jgi:hypothetical protein